MTPYERALAAAVDECGRLGIPASEAFKKQPGDYHGQHARDRWSALRGVAYRALVLAEHAVTDVARVFGRNPSTVSRAARRK